MDVEKEDVKKELILANKKIGDLEWEVLQLKFEVSKLRLKEAE